jgi:DNA polymerase-3 subunit delta'
MGASVMTVWDRVVGQRDLVATLQQTVAAAHAEDRGTDGDPRRSMTHAWLITGPPGSGRSVLAEAFAAALQCRDGGCGTCQDCQQVLADSHPSTRIVHADRLSYGVEDAKSLISWSATRPSGRHRRIIVLEDADRLTEAAANTLLKVLEEPPPRVVWLLCTPSTEDVLPTIRSRTRWISLATPQVRDVASFLIEQAGADPAMASFAARASQGHIGRAKALAGNEDVRRHRNGVLAVTRRVATLGGCFAAASDLVESAKEVAEAQAAARDAAEEAELLAGYGAGAEGVTRSKVESLARGALRELRDAQKKRRTRVVRDELDRDLVDLLGYYRDVLAVQAAADVPLVNEEDRPRIEALAASSTPDLTVRRMRAIDEARLALSSNVAPLVALEAMMVRLSGKLEPSAG